MYILMRLILTVIILSLKNAVEITYMENICRSYH
jgi:hypothetical protein